MADTGLKIEESVIQPDNERCVYLLVQNSSRDTHKSSIGTSVRQHEQYVKIISPGEPVNDETNSNEETVGLVNNIQNERVEGLKGIFRVSEDGLTLDEQISLRDYF